MSSESYLNLKLKFEYYPKIKESLLKDSIKIINENKEKWDLPFFIDTRSYLDINNIQQKTQHIISENLKNVIVLGTGGSIQSLLAIKFIKKKNISYNEFTSD